MIEVLVALAGMALTAPAHAPVAKAAKPAVKIATKAQSSASLKSSPPKKSSAPRKAPPAPVAEPWPRSVDATRVVNWVGSTGDNRSLPYIIVDKNAAHAFLFDAKGKFLSDAPVLIGIAPGDDATPGIGKKSLAEIGPAEKTTPAGRFLARFGLAAGKQKVLWVDYATSVALHMIPTGAPKEHRRERMLSPGIEDNRITFGCINVPTAFYSKVRPLFQRKGGYVYVLPDTKPIEEVFPPLRVQPFLDAAPS